MLKTLFVWLIVYCGVSVFACALYVLWGVKNPLDGIDEYEGTEL